MRPADIRTILATAIAEDPIRLLLGESCDGKHFPFPFVEPPPRCSESNPKRRTGKVPATVDTCSLRFSKFLLCAAKPTHRWGSALAN